MAEHAFAQLTKQQCEMMFPTYQSFLGSMGILLESGSINERFISI